MKDGLKKNNLGFFLTEGVPLERWEKMGIFNKEVEPYNILADHFSKIYIFTHGGKNELKYKKYFKQNIEIIYNETKITGSLYSFLLPFLHRDVIKKCSFLKTNQMLGIQALIGAKIFINRKSNLIVRTGHQLSFVRKRKKKYFGYITATLWEFIAYKICQKGLVTSKQIKENVTKTYKVLEDKITIIANYTNTELFKPNLDIKRYNNRVIYFGRIIPQKNIPNLIRALEGTGISLDLLGKKPDEEGLTKLGKELNVEIKFLPIVQNHEIPYIINHYKIFILPSKWEGMPKSLLEAMSCELACIGTNVAGTKELIKHEETGLLANTDPTSLRKKILELIDDENLQRRLGVNARKFILDNYSIDSEIKKEIKIYEELIW